MGRNCILWRTCGCQLGEVGQFSFPTSKKAENLKKQWLESLDLKLDVLLKIKSRKVVCFRHFNKDDIFFDEIASKYKIRRGKKF